MSFVPETSATEFHVHLYLAAFKVSDRPALKTEQVSDSHSIFAMSIILNCCD
jgi:hypothetical protein